MSLLERFPGPVSGDRAHQPVQRVVLVGASNLTRSIGLVLALARHAWTSPLEVHAALGHGRSYGQPSRVLGRQLPGILQCGLWTALARPSTSAPAALVTDIGNDILYEQPVERIAGWVETVLDRLADRGAQTVVTLLPVEHLPTMSRLRFMLLRSVLVPRCRLSLEAATERAYALNERVRQLAAERSCAVVPLRREWYGFDPIHIRWRHRRAAWTEILGPWSPESDGAHRPRAWRMRAWYLRSRVPEERRLWGLEQRGPQPAVRFRDGTTVALY
jgi:hypothetical protein